MTRIVSVSEEEEQAGEVRPYEDLFDDYQDSIDWDGLDMSFYQWARRHADDRSASPWSRQCARELLDSNYFSDFDNEEDRHYRAPRQATTDNERYPFEHATSQQAWRGEELHESNEDEEQRVKDEKRRAHQRERRHRKKEAKRQQKVAVALSELPKGEQRVDGVTMKLEEVQLSRESNVNLFDAEQVSSLLKKLLKKPSNFLRGEKDETRELLAHQCWLVHLGASFRSSVLLGAELR